MPLGDLLNMWNLRSGPVVSSNSSDLADRPCCYLRIIFSELAELLRPKTASIFAIERQRSLESPNRSGSPGVRISCLSWPQIKRIIDDVDIQIDSVELTGGQSIPTPNRFPNALLCGALLDSIVSHFSGHGLQQLVQLVIFADGEEIRFCRSIGRHKRDGDRSFAAQIVFHCLREIMEIILRSAETRLAFFVC